MKWLPWLAGMFTSKRMGGFSNLGGHHPEVEKPLLFSISPA
jgi:hypothetical protein